MKKLIQKALEASGHELVSIEHHHKLLAREEELGLCRARVREYDFLLSFDPVMAGQLMSWRPHSCGQLQQDLFVLATTEFRRRGYFVEFGAANGALAMTTAGDTTTATLAEIERLVAGGGARVQR